MYPAHLLVLLAGASDIPPLPLNLYQFDNMIQCANKGKRATWHYMDYGCYCGSGGSGTPVDALDRCCKAHDDCYGVAENEGCYPKWTLYSWQCTENVPTCDSKSGCALTVCACDATAAKCFAEAPYNNKNYNIDTSDCQ